MRMKDKRTHPEQPTQEELDLAHKLRESYTVDGATITNAGGSFGNPKEIGIRQAKSKMDTIRAARLLTTEEKILDYALDILIEDINYYYRYEKNYE